MIVYVHEKRLEARVVISNAQHCRASSDDGHHGKGGVRGGSRRNQEGQTAFESAGGATTKEHIISIRELVDVRLEF
eukprot:1536306-Pyramimonas_sp.AAC.1